MTTLHIPLLPETHNYAGDLIKALCFAASEILQIEFQNGLLQIETAEPVDSEELSRKIEKILKQFERNRSGLLDEIVAEKSSPASMVFYNPYGFDSIQQYGNGLISLKGEALQLLNGFDAVFRRFALKLGAVEMRYPTLLPLEAIKKTAYLRTSPQYSSFVCHPQEDIDVLLNLYKSADRNQTLNDLEAPRYVLSPAACFHCYMDLEGSRLSESTIITTRQNVFRNEGRLNWDDFGRLRDYEVRELVFVGNSEFVERCRSAVIEQAVAFLSEVGLSFRLCAAHDPFVVPAMQKFKKIQHEERSKYELQLECKPNQYLAAASFNIHGKAFTDPFDIKVNNEELSVTGCVGFGLERWVLAALSQWGPKPRSWPEPAKQLLEQGGLNGELC